MKEKPILLNAEMVRAVLDGRKTQTRRIIRLQPSADFHPMNMQLETDFTARWYTPGVVDKDGYLQPGKNQVFGVAGEDEGYICPFGAVGDRLWVREKTQVIHILNNKKAFVMYLADGEEAVVEVPDRLKPIKPGYCLSNGCYREASRITLEITGVRVERLQDISEQDAAAEGANTELSLIGDKHYLGYRSLWKSIYGADSWQANPWVWVIEFKRVE